MTQENPNQTGPMATVGAPAPYFVPAVTVRLSGPPIADRLLEFNLEHVGHALGTLFAQAREVIPADDPYGHSRSRCYSDAIGLLKASAKVAHSLALLNGGARFEHNINVRRTSDETSARRRPRRAAEPPTPPEVVEYDDVGIPNGLYDDSVHLSEGRVFVRGVGWRHPHPNSGGSNTPAGPAEPAEAEGAPKQAEAPQPADPPRPAEPRVCTL